MVHLRVGERDVRWAVHLAAPKGDRKVWSTVDASAGWSGKGTEYQMEQ